MVKVLSTKVHIGKPPALLSVFCLRVFPRFWPPVLRATEGISRHLYVQVSVDSAHHFVFNIKGSGKFERKEMALLLRIQRNTMITPSIWNLKKQHLSPSLVVLRHGRRGRKQISLKEVFC